MSLETQNDIMLALAGLYPDGYDGFPSGADTPQHYDDYAAMTLNPGATRHTAQELEAGIALYESRRTAAAQIRAARQQLRAYWESQPDYIVGPHASLWEAGQKHLDDGKPGRAYELIKHAPMPTTYTEAEAGTAGEVRTFLLEQIATLRAAMESGD